MSRETLTSQTIHASNGADEGGTDERGQTAKGAGEREVPAWRRTELHGHIDSLLRMLHTV